MGRYNAPRKQLTHCIGGAEGERASTRGAMRRTQDEKGGRYRAHQKRTTATKRDLIQRALESC